jgi:ATP-binding cassette subfamily F protein uup
MIREPDILLLDEPTNHLDIDSIVWLQGFLKRYPGTLIFVTHDRVFLQDMANRIVEVDRGRVFDWTCDYQTFLKRRDQLLAAEAEEQSQFDKKLAEEERWIRQGVKARRTRNEGRVRVLKEMREQRQQRRQKMGTAKMQILEAERSGALVARLEEVTHAFSGEPVINNFSTTVFRGDKIGIVGPNGAGKSTLLRLLLGQLTPSQGKVRLGTNLAVGYFDQLRNQLDETRSARENISDGTDFLMINGQKRHIMGFLQDFLFSPERAQTLVQFLSGGERNRLLLAKMMSKPANILVLDEPTNDLDAETLELLEDMLPAFPGTVLLVSHDRAFLNNVVTSTIVFEGNGVLGEYDGGYDDWIRIKEQRENAVDANTPVAGSSVAKPAEQTSSSATTSAVAKTRRLNFKEQRELDQLPELIASLEKRQKELEKEMATSGFYQSGGDKIAKVTAELASVGAKLEHCFLRWEELENGP